jgi:putative peptidoglycan lipid II flippase
MQRADFQSTLVVMSGLAFATLTGFLRQIVIAQQFGVGRAADIYLVAFALPEFVFIALPIVLAPAFLPPFTACRQQEGEAAAMQMGRWATVALLILLSIFTIFIGLSTPVIIDWIGPGFDHAERLRAIQSSRLMLPAINLMGLAILGGVVLQAYRRFLRPAFTTGVYNLTFVVILLTLPMMLLDDRAAWGVTLGAATAMILQWPVWRNFLSRLPLELNEKRKVNPTTSWMWLKQVARLAGPLGLGYTVHHLILIIDRAMATTLIVGSVAALDYASRLAQVVGQLGGLAVSTVLFPSLIAYIESNNLDGARRSLTDALRLVWKITLPACLGLIILRAPLVQVLFEHGAFNRGDTQMVSQALTWYSLSVLADAMCQPLWRVIYAQRQTRTVLAVNALQTGVRVFCNIVLIRYFGYNGLALSAVLGLSIQAFVLGLLVHRQLDFPSKFSRWREVGFVTLAGAIAAGVTYCFDVKFNLGGPVITLLVSGVSGISIYIMVLLCPKYLKKKKNKNLDPV